MKIVTSHTYIFLSWGNMRGKCGNIIERNVLWLVISKLYLVYPNLSVFFSKRFAAMVFL